MGFSGRETIYALSSGKGVAAVAVVRISGPGARAALKALCGNPPGEPRKMQLRTLRDPASGEIIDRALVVFFAAPHSFSGEDMVELQVHGSRAVIGRLLEVLGRLSGLRAARRGEFTRRALLNGRLDLVQVEALGDLLRAETDAQLALAWRGLAGVSSRRAETWRERLVSILGRFEAAIDFVDEEDVAERALAGVRGDVETLVAAFAEVLARAAPAQKLREGVRVVIAGPPNVGKSSLINWLAGREVAIVSERPGTTRDVIEVRLDLDGVEVVVRDTAGLRQAGADEVERIGIERAQAALREAEMVIWMQAPDVSSSAIPRIDSPLIRVFNKVDLIDSDAQRCKDALPISVRTGEGLDTLLKRLKALAAEIREKGESALFVRERQIAAIRAAKEELETVLARPDLPLELAAEHVRAAVLRLDELIGRVDVEEMLDQVFADFCIGK